MDLWGLKVTLEESFLEGQHFRSFTGPAQSSEAASWVPEEVAGGWQ